MKRMLLLVGLAVLLLGGLGALIYAMMFPDPVGELRDQYQRESDAATQNDLRSIVDLETDDFKFYESDGRLLSTRKDVEEEIQENPDLPGSATDTAYLINKVVVKGNHATVDVTEHKSVALNAQHPIGRDSHYRDNWVRDGAEWKLQRRTSTDPAYVSVSDPKWQISPDQLPQGQLHSQSAFPVPAK